MSDSDDWENSEALEETGWELEKCQEQLAEAVAMLRGLEWSGCDSILSLSVCPVCSEPEYTGTHAPDCKLVAFLRRHP